MLKKLVVASLLFVAATGRPQESDSQDQKKCVIKKVVKNDNVCTSRACVEVANSLFQNMDLTADPCEDFNQFACGGFIKNQIIPDDKGRLSSFTPASEELFVRGRILVESEPSKDDFETDVKARNYYKACMNADKIEEAGIGPVQKLLSAVGGWPVLEGEKWVKEGSEWYNFAVKSLELGMGINQIMSLSVYQDDKNISWRVIKLDQPSLGLSREYLIKGFDDKDVQHYYTYMVEAAKLMGANEDVAKAEMKESLKFEIQLANISTPREQRRDPNSKYHPTTVGEFGVRPGFPPSLKNYLNNIFAAGGAGSIKIDDNEKIIIRDPNYFGNATKLLVDTDKRVIANYLGWRLFKSRVGYMHEAARKLKEDYRRKLVGVAKSKPDWKRCVNAAGFNTYSGGMVGVAGSMYVRKYFKPEEKAVVNEMIEYVRSAFASMLNDIDWMDEETKDKARKKLTKMQQYIAYPEEVLDRDTMENYFKDMDFSDDDYFQNSLNLNKFDVKLALLKLREKVDPKHWTEHYSSALVNAFYNPDSNSMEFPAGILQGIFFNAKAPKYVNFGAIGSVIGHEITHGFDDQGRTKDFEGKLTDWWANSTGIKYKERAQCVIEQYGNYTAKQIKLNLNGINTQGENIADNGGLKEAYLGYNNYINKHSDDPKLPGYEKYTSKQMFWINFGQVWCGKYKDGTYKSQILTGVHSPGEFRIKGSLSNNPDFAADFKCKSGSPMNPVKKCSVW